MGLHSVSTLPHAKQHLINIIGETGHITITCSLTIITLWKWRPCPSFLRILLRGHITTTWYHTTISKKEEASPSPLSYFSPFPQDKGTPLLVFSLPPLSIGRVQVQVHLLTSLSF